MRDTLAGVYIVFMLIAGCSSGRGVAAQASTPATAVIAPAWSYEKNAVTLHIKADPQLNLFHQVPHTLLLCIYQLRDPNSFNQLQEERDGLQKLLECGTFDPSVLHARRLVIQPGQEISESLDRSEGARMVNIAAGYFSMQKDAVTRSFAVPLAEERQGKAVVQIPAGLSIDLVLGPKEIQRVR